MCETCDQIDQKLRQYERLRAAIGDKDTMDRIEILMVDIRAQKVGLHSLQEGCS